MGIGSLRGGKWLAGVHLKEHFFWGVGNCVYGLPVNDIYLLALPEISTAMISMEYIIIPQVPVNIERRRHFIHE